MPAAMPRLLVVSDSPGIASGQARVVRELASRFHRDGWQVACAGWFHFHAAEREFPYEVRLAIKERPESVAPILRDHRPDVVLCIGDPWDFRWLSQVRAQGGRFRLVGYLNIEGEPLPPSLEQVLDGFDLIATTSEYGARVVGRPGAIGIHHGVDRTVFRPVERQSEIAGRALAETFVVLANAQNTFRKNLPATIAGFAGFAKGKSDVLLYMNTMPILPEGSAPGPNLVDVVVQHGIEPLVCFNPENAGPLRTVPDEALNKIYAIADVLLVSSFGEGFGLPVLEAMATKTVPVALAAYSMPELLGTDRGLLYPVAGAIRGEQGMDLAVAGAEEIAGGLEEAYQAWRAGGGGLERFHRLGMAFAMARPWERTYEQLTGLIGMPVSRRAATGQAIDPYLRIRARRVAARHPGAIGLLKFGGLGDMLQTTVVVRAAARKHRAPVVVFTPGPAEVFQWMPEVAEIVPIKEMLQDDAVRTLADCFPVFLDVRYISWAYGADPPPFALRHAWFYQAWAQSNARLATLGRHTTELMLESLGLPQGETGLRPHFDPREPAESPVPPYLAVANGVGSLGILKAWPQPYWAELAQLLAPLPLVQVGGADDPRIVRALDQRGLSLAATASILEDAQGLVSVEGGIAHLGAAVGLRSVVLYGPTDPVLFTYPGQRPIQAEVCPPCWWSLPTWGDQRCAIGEPRCVNLPKPQDVVLAIREHLSAVYEGP